MMTIPYTQCIPFNELPDYIHECSQYGNLIKTLNFDRNPEVK